MSNQEQHPLAKWFGERKIVRLMLLAALLTLAVIHIGPIFGAAVLLLQIAKPLLMGAAVAYVLEIIIHRLESVLFPKAKSKALAASRRWIAVLIAVIVILSILALILFTVLPGLAQAVTLLAKELPVYFAQLKEWALKTFENVPTVRDYVTTLDFDWQEIQKRLIDWATNGVERNELLSSTVSMIGAVTGQISHFFISFIFAIFLLSSKRKLQHQFTRLIRALFNDRNETRILHVLSTANRCFSGFIVGQTLNGLVTGIATWLGMRIFGMPYALIVAVLSGTASLIPIIGGYIGAALGTFLVFTVQPGMALWFLLFIVTLQTVQGNTLYPRLLGSSVGIPSLWVLAAITLGGGIGGIGGMLVAVPLMATAYALVQEWVRKKNREETSLPAKQ